MTRADAASRAEVALDKAVEGQHLTPEDQAALKQLVPYVHHLTNVSRAMDGLSYLGLVLKWVAGLIVTVAAAWAIVGGNKP